MSGKMENLGAGMKEYFLNPRMTFSSRHNAVASIAKFGELNFGYFIVATADRKFFPIVITNDMSFASALTKDGIVNIRGNANISWTNEKSAIAA